jgi:hypothetical protein
LVVYYCVCVCILRVMFVPISSFFLSRCCSLYNEHHVFFFVARFFFSSFLFFFFFFYRNTFALACLREFSSSNSETIHLFDYTFFIRMLSREIRPKTQFVSTFLFLLWLAEARVRKICEHFYASLPPEIEHS